jgi:transposase
MATRFKNVDRDTPMLLPPDLRDWIPADHIVRFILDAVEMLRLESYRVNRRGTGSEQYPPGMMQALLIYCYSMGMFSSREIEMATYTDVAVRYICGGDHHPDHDTICTFRRENGQLFKESFIKVLMMAQEQKQLKKIGTIAVDGSKILANASKHAAVSYERAGEQIEFLEGEIAALMAKADEADNKPLEDGLRIPKEIARREDRIERLKVARAAMEARFQEYQKEKEKGGDEPPKKTRKKRDPTVPELMQHNFTDPDSRIMKAGSGQHFEQSFNAQAAVETDSMLIVGARVSQSSNDKKELAPTVESVPVEVYDAKRILTDSGYYSEDAIKAVEDDGRRTVYCGGR